MSVGDVNAEICDECAHTGLSCSTCGGRNGYPATGKPPCGTCRTKIGAELSGQLNNMAASELSENTGELPAGEQFEKIEELPDHLSGPQLSIGDESGELAADFLYIEADEAVEFERWRTSLVAALDVLDEIGRKRGVKAANKVAADMLAALKATAELGS